MSKHVPRFTNKDQVILQSLIQHYGADGVSHELSRIFIAWGNQNVRYRKMAKVAQLLAGHAALALGKMQRITAGR